ncbi:MAG: SAM-dependent chlorinase/fluorinase [Candidatus Bathyarchaeia archaeon]
MGSLIVTLLSDFGLRDSYVAEVKAAILEVCRNVILVDITHEVERHNVRMGAYFLARSAKIFPEGTVHLAVVDPGVGSGRRPIVIEGERAYFVGPDNGLLALAAREQVVRHVYKIENTAFLRRQISDTFHGRDVFAPVAGHLAAGIKPSAFGPEIFDYQVPKFSEAEVHGCHIIGEIIHIDNFGNIVTNITPRHLSEGGVRLNSEVKVTVSDGGSEKMRLRETYSNVAPGCFLAVVGSGGFLEVSINQGDAARQLRAAASKRVEVALI